MTAIPKLLIILIIFIDFRKYNFSQFIYCKVEKKNKKISLALNELNGKNKLSYNQSDY